MHWILQEDKDNVALAELLERMDIPYSVYSKLREDATLEIPIADG